ncbi:hypothetical protein O181_084603 [Austropuccinia psidii MF-1]|uniref:Uncharacterized protein n=1 Tax=Austropuccinia psidii MF-1 TaxID=1389203 RepID=A0A9Q3FVY0_9BASI|nr:hypothetical protein [Austropuccinia psidii MF-1]
MMECLLTVACKPEQSLQTSSKSAAHSHYNVTKSNPIHFEQFVLAKSIMNYFSNRGRAKRPKGVYGYINLFILIAFLAVSCQGAGICKFGDCTTKGRDIEYIECNYESACGKITIDQKDAPYKNTQKFSVFCNACEKVEVFTRKAGKTFVIVRCKSHSHCGPSPEERAGMSGLDLNLPADENS